LGSMRCFRRKNGSRVDRGLVTLAERDFSPAAAQIQLPPHDEATEGPKPVNKIITPTAESATGGEQVMRALPQTSFIRRSTCARITCEHARGCRGATLEQTSLRASLESLRSTTKYECALHYERVQLHLTFGAPALDRAPNDRNRSDSRVRAVLGGRAWASELSAPGHVSTRSRKVKTGQSHGQSSGT
jgi:hypothetical protein